MELNTGRLGTFLSDRLVIGNESEGIVSLRADNSFWGWLLRVISWICSPCGYSDENRRTINCVKTYLTDQLGAERLKRVCDRYDMSLDGLALSGSPLLSRDLAKIIVGIRDVKVEDIEDLIQLAKDEQMPWPERISAGLRDRLKLAINSEDLDSKTFAQAHQELSALADIGRKDVSNETIEEYIRYAKDASFSWPEQFSEELKTKLRKVETFQQLDQATYRELYTALGGRNSVAYVAPIKTVLSGAQPSECGACYFFDPLLADRERLEIVEENAHDSFGTFIHNFVVRIIGREMDIGMLIPAPMRPDPTADKAEQKCPQFYRVSAKVISGEGMVAYLLMPATSDANLLASQSDDPAFDPEVDDGSGRLRPILFFRGTSTRPSAIDAASTMITDMERDLGRTAYESGKPHLAKLEKWFGKIPIAAGHSLGSTTLQYFLVENGAIREAYLFNGPGLPEGEVEKFNARMEGEEAKSLKLIIRQANTDIFATVGSVHLGFDAPSKVEVNYRKIYPKNQTAASYAHVHVPDKEHRILGIEGGFGRVIRASQSVINSAASSAEPSAATSSVAIEQPILPSGLTPIIEEKSAEVDVEENGSAMAEGAATVSTASAVMSSINPETDVAVEGWELDGVAYATMEDQLKGVNGKPVKVRHPIQIKQYLSVQTQEVTEKYIKAEPAPLTIEEETHIRAELNERLNHKDHPDSREALRQTIGPCIARIIRIIRDIFRWLFGSRTALQMGVQYGLFDEKGKWVVRHEHANPMPSLVVG